MHVEGEEIRPEDFGEGAGWCNVKRLKQANGRIESSQNQQAQMQRQTATMPTTGTAQCKRKYTRQMQHIAMASRMPELPSDDSKSVVRPRGGFKATDYGTDRIYCCLRNAADRAKRYEAISKLHIGDREFEANAYRAALENTSKGLIRNISKNESPADIVITYCYNSSSSCGGNGSNYYNYPEIGCPSGNDNRRGRSTSRGARKSRSRSMTRSGTAARLSPLLPVVATLEWATPAGPPSVAAVGTSSTAPTTSDDTAAPGISIAESNTARASLYGHGRREQFGGDGGGTRGVPVHREKDHLVPARMETKR
ncbi:hypothetical protein HPB49_024364 [Dermacentor silvarum]|uniref:Uncharacterized protein n=1 Tax=Dermacentor silvarum TaxID=543639 RepID=A0ACB8D0M5_DERSI|nr:hypothetical protein HPB49_024364 [Dermacentor silvarum]